MSRQFLLIKLAVVMVLLCILPKQIWSETTDLNSTIADQDAKDKRLAACLGIDVKYVMMTDEELMIQRNKDVNLFHKSSDLLKDIIKTEDYKKIWDGSLWLPILITIIFTVAIVSVILYAINICCCCERKRTNMARFCVKLNLCFAVLAFVVFLITIIAMCIFLSNSRESINYVNCSFHIMNDDIKNGASYTEANLTFQGLSPLQNIFTAYGNSLNAIVQNHANTFSDIIALNLPITSKAAVDAIEPMYTDFKDKTTSDGVGEMTKPISVTNVLPSGNVSINAEFNKLYADSLNMHEAALIGKSIITSGDPQIYQASITSANEEITAIMAGVDKYINQSNTYFSTVADKFDAVQMIYIIFNFLCLILAIIIAIGICCVYHKDKCKCLCVWRILIFILGILCALFFAFTFFVTSISFMTSSSCKIIAGLNTDAGIDDFVDTFNIGDQFNTLLKTCYSETASGDIGQVFLQNNSSNSPEMQVFNDAKTMLSIYEKYTASVAKIDVNGNANSTQELDDAFEQYRAGINNDHANVAPALAELNSAVDCANIYYSLTPVSCITAETKTCRAIQLEAGFIAPVCLTSNGVEGVATAKTNFDNLKKYLNETQALMTIMIDGINGTNGLSLNSKYKVAALAYLEAATEFNKAKVDQQEVIDLFGGDLRKQTDCRIVRLHVQIIEDAICFKTTAELYSFMVVSVIGSIFFFCFVWNLCCAEYCLWNDRQGKDSDNLEEEDHQDVRHIPVNTQIENDVIEDDFYQNSVQQGYLNNSESQPFDKNQNIEYKNKEVVAEDDFMGPQMQNHAAEDDFMGPQMQNYAAEDDFMGPQMQNDGKKNNEVY